MRVVPVEAKLFETSGSCSLAADSVAQRKCHSTEPLALLTSVIARNPRYFSSFGNPACCAVSVGSILKIQRTSSCLESHFTTLSARQRSRTRRKVRPMELLSDNAVTTFYLERILIPNSLHIPKQNLLPAAVI